MGPPILEEATWCIMEIICPIVSLCVCVAVVLVPLKLQELLMNCNLPNEFLLPFDPRIKAGRILVSFANVLCV